MFNRLFGKPKEQDPLDKLNETLDMLEKKQIVLEKKAASEHERAKVFSKTKNERAAMHSLKRRNMYDKQIEQLVAHQLKIDNQIIMLEAAKAAAETVHALKTGAKAMKVMQKATSINDVDKTMDKFYEQTDYMEQIQDALSAPIGASADFDEDELKAELEKLRAELESQLLKPVAAAPYHPVQVPHNKQPIRPAPKKASAKEDESGLEGAAAYRVRDNRQPTRPAPKKSSAEKDESGWEEAAAHRIPQPIRPAPKKA